MRARATLALLPALFLLAGGGSAQAAGPPTIEATWVEAVTATSANLRAEIDPNGVMTRYHFEYLSEAAYLANGESFAGATHKPTGEGALVPGAGIAVFQHLEGLAPQTPYYYRVVASNSASETTAAPAHLLVTSEATNVHPPLDGRGFELVSPIDKGGGAVGEPGGIFGGGDFQAAASSESPALTWSSASSSGGGAGAPGASQYLSVRGAGGWSTQNITEPSLSGAYGDQPDGVPYRVFSADLARALLLDPRRCEAGEACPRPYSLRQSASGALTSLPAQAAGMRVVGASPGLDRIWFEAEGGEVFEWSGGAGLVPSAAPPAPSAERVIGPHRLFLSDAEIPPFDNIDANSGEPDTEVYLEGPPPGGGASRLLCVSCNPSGERPQGSSTIPGAQVNGSTAVYEPRVLSASGNRVFFDSSDRLVSADTDGVPDVYEWEAAGEGDCTRRPGCLGLVSGGGRGSGGYAPGASFLDASADGADVYFTTEESLIPSDPGSIDAYDYREDGGFPEPEAPFVCEGDACQALPSPPEDPSPGTLVKNSGNPAQKYYSPRKRKHRKKRHRHRHKHGGKRRQGRHR